MYILESKGNYTLVINDIDTVIMPGKKYELSDSDFNNSSDIKKLSDLLIITSDNKSIVDDNINNVEINATIFVAHPEDDKIVENVFVRQSENNLDPTETPVIDEIKSETEVEAEETKKETIETEAEIVKAETEVTETEVKVEVVENATKKQKSTKESKEATDKPKKQKGRPKKNNK